MKYVIDVCSISYVLTFAEYFTSTDVKQYLYLKFILTRDKLQNFLRQSMSSDSLVWFLG